MPMSLLRNAAIALMLLVGSASLAMADEPAVIAAADAAAHVGQKVTVQDVVANVKVSTKGTTFLNFGQAFPNQVFSAVILKDSAAPFGDLTQYQGKKVQVTGQINLRDGKPQILVETPDQLRVVP